MRARWPGANAPQTAQEGRWLQHAVEAGRDMGARDAALYAASHAVLQAWDRWQGPGIPHADMVAAFERLREALR